MTFSQRGLISIIAVFSAFPGIVSAQPVIVAGTGDPNLDVSAVQAAVDKGGEVVLKGHFSFNRPATAPAGALFNRMITASKNVVISGAIDNGEMPTIDGGEWPFLVDAAAAVVTIQGLHFVHPKAGAIWIFASAGITVSGCRIENIEPSMDFGLQAGQSFPVSTAIFVGADPHPPSKTELGHPEYFSGTLSILNNEIDVGAIPAAQTLGVVMFSVGRSPDKEVDIYVSGNTIKNVNEPAINFRYAGQRTHAERNVLVTGAVPGLLANPDVIRVVGAGSYMIAHNSIDCGWPDGSAVGINIIGQGPPLIAESNAIVVDNDVTMSASDGTVAVSSAGIQIRGFAQGNSVLNNRIRGHARAGVAVITQNAGIPGNNSLIANDLSAFQSSVADIYIDTGVTDTAVFARPAHVEDHGNGTVVVMR